MQAKPSATRIRALFQIVVVTCLLTGHVACEAAAPTAKVNPSGNAKESAVAVKAARSPGTLRVVDAATGKPVPRARLLLRTPGCELTALRTSGSGLRAWAGNYYRPGLTRVEVHARAYESATWTWDRHSGGVESKDQVRELALCPRLRPDVLEVVLSSGLPPSRAWAGPKKGWICWQIWRRGSAKGSSTRLVRSRWRKLEFGSAPPRKSSARSRPIWSVAVVLDELTRSGHLRVWASLIDENGQEEVWRDERQLVPGRSFWLLDAISPTLKIRVRDQVGRARPSTWLRLEETGRPWYPGMKARRVRCDERGEVEVANLVWPAPNKQRQICVETDRTETARARLWLKIPEEGRQTAIFRVP
ncbi:MAG: hypothetical protein V3W41_00170 [Planctomycetota bacterium]